MRVGEVLVLPHLFSYQTSFKPRANGEMAASPVLHLSLDRMFFT